MTIKKNNFIEIEFTGKLQDGEIFDTTRKPDAKTAGMEQDKLKPLILSVGNSMVVKGLDDDFISKEIGKEYNIDLSPEKSFGKRDASLVQMVPLKNFLEQKIDPQKGMQFTFDGKLARIVSVSSGRVLVDFNNPLAGKNINYNYKILRIVEDKKEQLDSLQEFFFKRKFDSEKTEKGFKVFVEKDFTQLYNLMKKKFEEILGTSLTFDVLDKKATREKA